MLTIPGIATAADEAALLIRARQAGLGLEPARPCYAGAAPPGRFLFWFSHMAPEQLEEGMRRLAHIV